MSEARAAELPGLELVPERLGFFRWGSVGGRILLSNDAGDWAALSDAELADLLAGRIAEGHPRHQELTTKGFLREGLDLDALIGRIARRSRHVGRGPYLHILNLSTRCLQGCARCRRFAAQGADMSAETGGQIIDLALQGASPSVHFHFQAQGGEPLVNLGVLRQLVETARLRNQQTGGKSLSFSIGTNFSGMTEEAAEWLLANDVRVCTSLDGPAALHDANRRWKHGSPHAEVVRWIDHFARRCNSLGKSWQVEALPTTTRASLGAWREIVDEYVARGLRSLQFRPLDPAAVGPQLWAEIGYTMPEYLDFYRRALDYVLELDRRGTHIAEGTAAIFLSGMAGGDGGAAVDLRSTAGEGINQVAYEHDGQAFPSDEARELAALGDPMFQLGEARHLDVPGLLRHPTVRAVAAASLLDCQPRCAECWNKPFCGFSPVRNYRHQGDLVGQRPHCLQCKEHMAVSERLFALLFEAEPAVRQTLEHWAKNAARLSSDPRLDREAP